MARVASRHERTGSVSAPVGRRVRAATSAYFALQGALVLLWWVLLLSRPDFAAYFSVQGAPEHALRAFMLPDLLVAGCGSLVASLLCLRERPWAPRVLWFVTGAVVYATLYCVALSAMTGDAWAGVFLMLPAAAASLGLAALASRGA